MQQIDAQRQYGREKETCDRARGDEMHSIMERLNQRSGGILYGVAFNLEDLTKPITTTSGAVSPYSDMIRSLLMDHQPELKRIQELQQQSFPSFEQWGLDTSSFE